jgi:hypothetical protein
MMTQPEGGPPGPGGVVSEDSPAYLAGLRPGTVLAGYRLEAQVGAGGFGVVFRARDERLGRLVALKILAPAAAADEEFRRRFIAEWRAAAAVDDPHVIPVYDAGQAGGVLFIAMRLVPGGDLRRVLEREGPLPPGRAAEFIAPVASALDAAHRAGLVHRDVKPANILVDARDDQPDQVYLSDFGVSKAALATAGLTGSGHFLGTPDYCAPEQIQGRAVDGRADQYALACLAYQLLTGTPPFRRDHGLAVLLAHLSEPPPPLASRVPGLPGAADQVLARALAKAPDERYASCREFAEALEQALGLPADRPRRPVPAPRHPRPRIAPPPAESPRPARAGTAAVPANQAAAGTMDWVPGGGPTPTADVPEAAARATGPARTGPGAGFTASRFPRHRLAAIALVGTVLAAAVGIPLVLTSSPNAPKGASSPRTASSAKATRSAKATGSPRATISPATMGYGRPAMIDLPSGGVITSVAFSPGGTTLAVGDHDGSTYLWNTATRSQIAAFTDPGSEGVGRVAFSPSGTTLATTDVNGHTYLWDVGTGRLIATFTDPHAMSVDAVAFSPSGTTLATGDLNGHAYLWDVATGRLTATFTAPGGGGAVTSVAFSPSGTTLAVGDGSVTYLWDVAARSLANAFILPNTVESVAFSPSGTTLAAGDVDASTYLWDVATQSVTATLTNPGGAVDESVAFSPGGTTLAVGSSGNLVSDTFLWDVATRHLTQTLADQNIVLSVAFSPSGTLAAGDNGGSVALWQPS